MWSCGREDLHYYSVPHYLYRKEPKRKVKMVYDDRIVAVYYDNIRIARSASRFNERPYFADRRQLSD